MRGVLALIVLPAFAGPLLIAQVAERPLTLIDGSSVIPISLVVGLIIAVFKAGTEFQKLTASLKVLDRLDRRVKSIERAGGFSAGHEDDPTLQ